jgi:hypothetical protein
MSSVHKIAIVVKFLQPTQNLGARVKLILPRFDNKSVTFYFHPQEGRDTLEKAENFLAAHKIICEENLDLETHYVLTVPFLGESKNNLLKLFKEIVEG